MRKDSTRAVTLVAHSGGKLAALREEMMVEKWVAWTATKMAGLLVTSKADQKVSNSDVKLVVSSVVSSADELAGRLVGLLVVLTVVS